MGSVKKILYKANLSDREMHHSRLFIDVAENIHIHHREYRTVFAFDEFFEYADILQKSTEDVRNFLEQNPNYHEGAYPTTIMIAGGKDRQLRYIDNSPNPNESFYFSNDFAIELQDVFVTDEIHIHYRDFRIALDRKRFREMAEGFSSALQELDNFEHTQAYKREYHPDRVIIEANDKKLKSASIMGVQMIPIHSIKSYWLNNPNSSWKGDRETLKQIQREYKSAGRIAPIILSTEKNGENFIVDGHHRYAALKEIGESQIEAIVIPHSFEETKLIREAEAKLKEFDINTNFEYSVSSFFKSYIGYRLNRFYSSAFKKKMKKQSWWWRSLRKLKRIIFGKKLIFKSFNEAHNHHN